MLKSGIVIVGQNVPKGEFPEVLHRSEVRHDAIRVQHGSRGHAFVEHSYARCERAFWGRHAALTRCVPWAKLPSEVHCTL